MQTLLEDVMISAIEHYSYCPRQCALIHIEQVYDENVFTLKGNRVHTRVDTPTWEMNGDTRIERALPLWSEAWGIYGKADAVEFRANKTLYPVETKHGGKREKIHDDLQLCAQAVCLEEMFAVSVTQGAIFYHSSRRRREVEFTLELRAQLEGIVLAIRDLYRAYRLPVAPDDARCPNCSLNTLCVPSGLESRRVAYYARELYRIPLDEPIPTSLLEES